MAGYGKTIYEASYLRRSKVHDYKAPCVYLITLAMCDGLPAMSVITPCKQLNGKSVAVLKRTPAGDAVKGMMLQFEQQFKSIRVLRSVIMPDHVHLVFHVRERIAEDLGRYIAIFKTSCNKAYLERGIVEEKCSVFKKGFNDKIAIDPDARGRFCDYVADNPRRYMIKHFFPEYFYHRLMIDVEGKSLGLFGNLGLLDSSLKSAVKLSRRVELTPDLAQKRKRWDEVIRCGGVLVSPFINPAERDYYKRAIAEGASVILIVNYKYGERSKPYGKLFDLCQEGRLLIISTERLEYKNSECNYIENQEMNKIAAAVAAIEPGKARLKAR